MGCNTEFWCVEFDCPSYNNGFRCSDCAKYGKCNFCVLQDFDKNPECNPDYCADIAHGICYGWSEDYE